MDWLRRIGRWLRGKPICGGCAAYGVDCVRWRGCPYIAEWYGEEKEKDDD